MKTYTIEQLSRKMRTSATKKDRQGNPLEFESIGLKIEGEWYNGFGKQGVTDQWDSGMEISGIELYQNGEYKNWKFVSIEERFSEIEERLTALEGKQIKAPF